MNYSYEIVEAKGFRSIKRIDENGNSVWIPSDELNKDYINYLKWAEENNGQNN